MRFVRSCVSSISFWKTINIRWPSMVRTVVQFRLSGSLTNCACCPCIQIDGVPFSCTAEAARHWYIIDERRGTFWSPANWLLAQQFVRCDEVLWDFQTKNYHFQFRDSVRGCPLFNSLSWITKRINWKTDQTHDLVLGYLLEHLDTLNVHFHTWSF